MSDQIRLVDKGTAVNVLTAIRKRTVNVYISKYLMQTSEKLGIYLVALCGHLHSCSFRNIIKHIYNWYMLQVNSFKHILRTIIFSMLPENIVGSNGRRRGVRTSVPHSFPDHNLLRVARKIPVSIVNINVTGRP